MSDKTVELLTDFRNGSEAAFKIIYDAHYAKIYRFAYSFLKDKFQSQEILQETFINFWVYRERFDSSKAIEPYLFTICKRLVLDNFKRAASTHLLREQLLLKVSEIHNTTEEGIIFSDLMNFAEKAIAELPRQQQLIFRLSRFEGLSYDEIAERLNLSKHTVKNHLVIALKTLKAQFSSQEMIYMLLLFIIS